MLDRPYIAKMLTDAEIMSAWEHTFDDAGIDSWIAGQQRRYKEDGFGYYLAVDKEQGLPVGQAGLLKEPFERRDYPALGYILMREHWGKGYALEAARACMDYAFDQLGAPVVTASIRPDNEASMQVSRTLGMKPLGMVVKQYRGKEMPHQVMGHRADMPRRGQPKTVTDALDRLGIEYELIRHRPAYTMADLAEIRPRIGDALVVKNLFFETRNRDKRFLVLVAGDKRVRGADIAAQVSSSRLSFGSLSDMYRLLGAPLGSLGPLGLIFDRDHEVAVAADRRLVYCDKLSFHPLRNDQSVLISSRDLFDRFFPDTGHQPLMVDIPDNQE